MPTIGGKAENMNAKTEAAVRKHGEELKAIFGMAATVDPVNLCRRLRRLERAGEALGLRLCNGPEFDAGEAESIQEEILKRLDGLTGYKAAGVPVFLNLDPRGYALKIDDKWAREYRNKGGALYTDWGGYGIIAPDLTETK